MEGTAKSHGKQWTAELHTGVKSGPCQQTSLCQEKGPSLHLPSRFLEAPGTSDCYVPPFFPFLSRHIYCGYPIPVPLL